MLASVVVRSNYLDKVVKLARAVEMSKAPRLLDVQVAAHGVAWEWKLPDQQDLIMSGLEASRDDAQREGDSALFERLLAGRAKPLCRNQK